jgi:hypothetical protein
MQVGQEVFIEGAGNFTVVSKPTPTSATLNYANIGTNTATGNTISTGGGVGPSGKVLSNLPAISDYKLAGSQAIGISARILNSQVTLAAGTYLLIATARFDFNMATFNTERDLIVKLRRTNNGPIDIPNAIATVKTGLTVLVSKTLDIVPMPAVIFTATAGDTLQLFAGITGLPYSGSLDAVETSIVAVKVF